MSFGLLGRLIGKLMRCLLDTFGLCGPSRFAVPRNWGVIWINAITVGRLGFPIIPAATGTVPSVSVWRKSGGLKQEKRIYSPLPTSTWFLPSPKDLGPWR